jgi:glycerol-3-phosphate dehydrogenase
MGALVCAVYRDVPYTDEQIAAGLKELQLESAFTHLAQMHTTREMAHAKTAIGAHAEEDTDERAERKKIPVERSGGGT